MNPLKPIQTPLYDAVHQSKLILHVIQWGLYGWNLSQIVTRILGRIALIRRGQNGCHLPLCSTRRRSVRTPLLRAAARFVNLLRPGDSWLKQHP